jgi:hypothetical protein
MRKAILLLLTLLAFAVFALAQTTSAPANQNSPTSSNPNATASPNPTAPQTTMPPDTTPSGTPSSTQSNPGATPAPGASDQAAQNNQSATTSQPASGGDVAASTELRATLDTPLSTKTSKVGDTFTSTLVEPIHASGGQVAIPAGSKIHGEVTEADEGKTVAVLRGKGKLNMHFRDIQLPDGTTVPLSATLISVHSTKSKTSTGSEGEVQSGNTAKRTVKDVGIGAGIGTVAGLIFGSALKGLAIGALAGGGYVLATGGKQVELPAQTGLVLRLDHNLSVPANTATR